MVTYPFPFRLTHKVSVKIENRRFFAFVRPLYEESHEDLPNVKKADPLFHSHATFSLVVLCRLLFARDEEIHEDRAETARKEVLSK